AGLVPGEPAHMPFYVTLFVIGIVAGRAHWLSRMDARTALPWFAAGALIFLALAIPATPRLAQPDTMQMRIVWAYLEPVVGVGMMLGIVVLFRRYLSADSRLLHALEGNIYGVYLIHLFVVIALQVALLNFQWPALLKFLVVLAGTLAISLPLIALLRRIPPVRAVM
ncbi:MAG: acyltransferase family protein, partial [Hyphomicrobiaceae bacterium]|nr:acyltransferase family protein [Hyphomicrobiaceae bacterium]